MGEVWRNAAPDDPLLRELVSVSPMCLAHTVYSFQKKVNLSEFTAQSSTSRYQT